MLTDELLWDYADGFLEGPDKLHVEAYLRQHPEQKARLDAIMAEKRAFSEISLEKPDAGFAQKVVAAWAKEHAPAPAKNKGRDWILWSIGLAFALLVALPFLMTPTGSGFSMQIPKEYIPEWQAPSFDWAGLLGSAVLRNTLLLTLAFMSLKLLDKYLQVRKAHLLA